jgi:Photosystem II complex subunit Ycf12
MGYLSKLIGLSLGGVMDFLTNITSGLSGVNFEAIVQLTCLALIVLAGPVVIFVLAFRGGDL